jgi:hypothetical protein
VRLVAGMLRELAGLVASVLFALFANVMAARD